MNFILFFIIIMALVLLFFYFALSFFNKLKLKKLRRKYNAEENKSGKPEGFDFRTTAANLPGKFGNEGGEHSHEGTDKSGECELLPNEPADNSERNIPDPEPNIPKSESDTGSNESEGKSKRVKESSWITHCREYWNEHPELSYREVLREAKNTYKK
jgi:hypothetical protein